MNRLEPVLIEIEQQTMPVLVVSHVSVLQVRPNPPTLPLNPNPDSHPEPHPPRRARPALERAQPCTPTHTHAPARVRPRALCARSQVLLCYFLNRPVSEAPEIEVPLHTVIELQPTVGGPYLEVRTPLLAPVEMPGGGMHRNESSALDLANAGREAEDSSEPGSQHGSTPSEGGTRVKAKSPLAVAPGARRIDAANVESLTDLVGMTEGGTTSDG